MTRSNVVSIRPEEVEEKLSVRYKIGSSNGDAVEGSKLLGTRDLYPGSFVDSARSIALRLLDDVIEALASAEESSNDYVQADTDLMRARVLLAKAFDHRSEMGEGYASVVSAALLALANGSVDPLTRKQVFALRNVIHRLRQGPHLHFDSAMVLLDELEAHSLDIEPSSLDGLLIEHHG